MVVLLLLIAAGAFLYARTAGLRGQQTPGLLETRVARAVRSAAVPADVKARRMPPPTGESLYAGMEHYARYCALCHANNGGGANTPLGEMEGLNVL
jgi:hypothetical protein